MKNCIKAIENIIKIIRFVIRQNVEKTNQHHYFKRDKT